MECPFNINNDCPEFIDDGLPYTCLFYYPECRACQLPISVNKL